MDLSRRRFIALAGASATLAVWPRLPAFGAARSDDTRFLLVLLRGGLDGLHALPPIGDADYRRLRGALAVENAHVLGNGFGLHPALGFANELYASRQLLPVVAIAPPYRGRSHFEAQDSLESGGGAAGHPATGWLNRCAASMQGTRALAVAAVTPLAARGPGPVDTWSPPLAEDLDPMMLQRLQPLYSADPQLAAAFGEAMQRASAMDSPSGNLRLPQAMQAAARFMSAPGGPRLAFVEDSGWDSHGGQALQLNRKLGELDAGLRAFREQAGGTWSKTVVAVVTEFGRTAAANGTGGTDHGTGGVALLAGGAVRGGRIAGEWPGLSGGALFEGRDLHATTDMRSLFKSILVDHLHVDPRAVESTVFQGSSDARPMQGLVA